jgi:hypothetical protein
MLVFKALKEHRQIHTGTGQFLPIYMRILAETRVQKAAQQLLSLLL